MTVRRLVPWAAVALAGTAAAFLATGGDGWRERRPAAAPRGAPAAAVSPGGATAAGPPARVSVCVTPSGPCVVAPARAGDPCGCPHPLRGSVRGNIEGVGAVPRRSRPGDRPGQDGLDPLYDWEDTLVGP